jgi:DNA-binding MarR family transcriptional regulator
LGAARGEYRHAILSGDPLFTRTQLIVRVGWNCHAQLAAVGNDNTNKELSPMSDDVGKQMVKMLRHVIVALVRREGADLTTRQIGVFLTCYLDDEAQTVRGLATKLNISKPAISRALDRLSEFDLARRRTDPLDRRSVLVQRAAAGMAFLRDLKATLTEAARGADTRITEFSAQE